MSLLCTTDAVFGFHITLLILGSMRHLTPLLSYLNSVDYLLFSIPHKSHTFFNSSQVTYL